MSNLIIVADFNPLGSGYKSIAVGLGTELANRGHRVWVLGAKDRGWEHPYPFSVVPISGAAASNEIYGLVRNINADFGVSDVILMSDMPVVFNTLERCGDIQVPFSGLFPLEAPPLTQSYAIKLMTLKRRFLLSRFGQEALAKQHVSSDFVGIPADPFWCIPTEEQRNEARESLGLERFTFLTVAENQERKNLSATAEIISKTPDAYWALVTRTRTNMGWNITDLLEYYGITERTLVVEKGIPQAALRQLYYGCDAFIITSKAEGLGMPVLEAMACGLQVIAPRHTAFEEHLCDGRGILFDNAFAYLDPFGNQLRWFPNTDQGAEYCSGMINETDVLKLHRIEQAIAYVNSRSWQNVGDVVCQALQL